MTRRDVTCENLLYNYTKVMDYVSTMEFNVAELIPEYRIVRFYK